MFYLMPIILSYMNIIIAETSIINIIILSHIGGIDVVENQLFSVYNAWH